MKKSILFILASFLLLFCSSCSHVETTAVSTSSLFYSLPTSETGTGVVYGVVKTKDNAPLESILFLSKNLAAGDPDLPATLAFSYNHDPRAKQTDDGEFLFTNIAPGEYCLVFWTIGGITVAPDVTNSNAYFLIDVKADDQLNLGNINMP